MIPEDPIHTGFASGHSSTIERIAHRSWRRYADGVAARIGGTLVDRPLGVPVGWPLPRPGGRVGSFFEEPEVDDRSFEGLVDRLDRLESENRDLAARLERAASRAEARRQAPVLIGLALAVLAFFGWRYQRSNARVFAESFTVVDAKGRERAVLEVDRDGTSTLALSDPRGKRSLEIASHRDGIVGMWISDARGQKRIGLSMSGDAQSCAMSIHHPSGQPLLTFGARPDQTGGLSVFDAAGQERLRLGTNAEGIDGLQVADPSGLRRVVVGVGARGVPVIGAYAPDGTLFFQVPGREARQAVGLP